MLELFGSGLSNFNDIDRKMQSHACQGMVAINSDLIIFDTDHSNSLLTGSAFIRGMKLHTRLN